MAEFHQASRGASNDHKKSVQRLYRYAQQLVQRLDQQLQNASEWKEFFDGETVLIRQKLKDTCEQLLFNGTFDISRKVEELLWRKGFYDLIQKTRQEKKTLQNDPSLLALYNAHLSAAHSFYHHLLLRIKDNFDLPFITSLDWLSAVENKRTKNADKVQEEVKRRDATEWAIKACQRCLLYLGDLARYRMDIGYSDALALAERFYHQAIWVNPDNGMPHNQLGTLKQQANYSDCEVAYHYMRCLASVNSFEGAEENLKRTFDRNRWSRKEIMSKAEGEEANMVDLFLIEFLELQERFRYERLHSNEFSKICQSVIEKFAGTLNLSIWSQISSSIPKNPNNIGDFIQNCNTDSSQRLSDGLMVKIFTICIITVSDLFQRNSEILSAAVAFTFTMLSKLLDYITKSLSESPLSTTVDRLNITQKQVMKQQQKSADENSKAINGEHDVEFKLKKRRVRLMKRYRRRRRGNGVSSSEDEESNGGPENQDREDDEDSGSDLSEGELASRLSSSSHEESEEELSSPNGPNDLVSAVNKRRREADRNKIISLCEVGKLLSAQINREQNEEGSPGFPREGRFLNFGSHLELPTENSLEVATGYLTEFCYLHTMKVMADWLRYAGDIMDIYGKDLSCVWQKIARALNELPAHQLLLSVLQCTKRRHNLTEMSELKDPFHEQKKVLPEDKSLIGLPLLTMLHRSLDYDWDSRTKDAVLFQFIIRVQSLKSFGYFLGEKIPLFGCEMDKERFIYGFAARKLSNSKADSPTIDRPQPVEEAPLSVEEAKQVDTNRNQAHFMKALAKQKLMHEVSELEDKMNSTGTNKKSDMPPYLIVDSQALCRHLSLIRSLAKSREFIIIVPIQVVQALDELKRYNPSAREAIKYLEEEFRQRSRWLRSQHDEESLDCDFNRSGKKKKNLTIEEWRFFQVIKCASYFASKHDKQVFVSILTSRITNETAGSLGTRATSDALEACRKIGIEVEPLVDFYQRWVAKKNT